MREVVPHSLWIGNAAEGRNGKLLFDTSIEAVVDLAVEEAPAHLPREIVYCRFPLNDGGGNSLAQIRAVMDTLLALLQQGIRTLVCCGGGISRSPALVAHVVARLNGQSPEECLRFVTANQPHDVSTTFWAELSQAMDVGN